MKKKIKYDNKKIRKKKSNLAEEWNCGMITVEAAYLIPYIMLIIGSFFYIAFYYIDQAKISCACSEAAIYASMAVDKGCDMGNGKISPVELNRVPVYQIFSSHKDEETEIGNKIKKQIKNQLLIIKVEKVKVEITGSKIRVNVSGRSSFTKIPFPGIKQIAFVCEKKVKRGDYADTMRKTDAFSEEKEP